MRTARLLATSVAVLALLGACKDEKSAGASVTPEATASATEATATVPQIAPVSTFKSETKEFRDWSAVCDNVNNCAAFGPAEDDNGFVMVKLAAGPDARATVQLASWTLGDGGGPFTATIDGQTFNGRTGPTESENSVLTIERASDQLLRALSQGRDMRIHAAKQSIPVSLSGAAAAFLWIDERQGRLGTTTALIRKGDRPASTVPAAPSAPRLTAAPAIAQTSLPAASPLPKGVFVLPAVKACQSDSIPGQSEDYAVKRLGPDQLLWEVPCGAGAYNFSQAYILTRNDGSQARQIIFPTASGTEETLVNSSYDPQSRTMSAFGKGRGIGDCGRMGEWVWTGETFALKEEFAMFECLGMSWDIWPSTWKTAS